MHKKYANNDILLSTKLREELHILKLKQESDTNYFFEKIATIQMTARKIDDNTISDRYNFSKIITAESNMSMPVIRSCTGCEA